MFDIFDALKKQLDAQKSENEALKEQIKALKTKDGSLKEQIEALKAKDESLSTFFHHLLDEVNDLTEKTRLSTYDTNGF